MLSNIQNILSYNHCIFELFCVPCPSRLARLRAPPSLSLLSSFLSSACDERISWEEDFRAGMEVRVLFEGENRSAAEQKGEYKFREADADGVIGEENWGDTEERDIYPDWITVIPQLTVRLLLFKKPSLFCLPSRAWN